MFKSTCKVCISCIEFIILELSINNKLNNEHEVKKSERGNDTPKKHLINGIEVRNSTEMPRTGRKFVTL